MLTLRKVKRNCTSGAKWKILRTLLFCSTLTLAYQVFPKILWKIPPSSIVWEDNDFSLLHSQGESEIVILHWTGQFRQRSGVSLLGKQKCEALSRRYFEPTLMSTDFPSTCRVTFDRRYLQRSNALLFHSFDLMYEHIPTPDQRATNQLWIWFQLESPIYTRLNLQQYSDTFNWTMTYRRDSDVYSPYSVIVRRRKPVNDSIQNARKLFPQKKRLIAWIVSSCDSNSRREYLVSSLQRFVPVDVYGWCGSSCPNNGSCYRYVETTHKFYLSFENSLCTDYITEKFFNAMASTMVPVVYGGGSNSDYATIAPVKSYIDVSSFKSVEDLSKYLLYLDMNDTAYLEYFKWKDEYEVSMIPRWCEVCQQVYLRRQRSSENKWYHDIWRWWNYKHYETIQEMSRFGHTLDHTYRNEVLGDKICSPSSSNRSRVMENIAKTETSGYMTYPDFEPSLSNGRVLPKYWDWATSFVFTS